jgi:hypothetical protein
MNPSPKILHVSWGTMEIEGGIKGKDFVLYPGGAEPWDWNISGTNHDDGIQVIDVEKIMKKGAKKIVLSQGFYGRLKVSEDAENLLIKSGIEYRIMKTDKAVEEYNNLCEEGPVGGLFHSTC